MRSAPAAAAHPPARSAACCPPSRRSRRALLSTGSLVMARISGGSAITLPVASRHRHGAAGRQGGRVGAGCRAGAAGALARECSCAACLQLEQQAISKHPPRRTQVEAEAVDVIFLHPPAQRVQDLLRRRRVVGVHRVAAAAAARGSGGGVRRRRRGGELAWHAGCTTLVTASLPGQYHREAAPVGPPPRPPPGPPRACS